MKSGVKDETLIGNKQYQKTIGSLLYIAMKSRPDIAANILFSDLNYKIFIPI